MTPAYPDRPQSDGPRPTPISDPRGSMAAGNVQHVPLTEPALGRKRSSGEALVAAGRVALAGPLVELLPGGAGAVGDVQAQAAVLVLELPGPVGKLNGQPQAVGPAVLGPLEDGRLQGGGGTGDVDVQARVLVLQLTVAAGNRVEPELLVRLARRLAAPLVDRGVVGGAGPGHVHAQPVVVHLQLLVTRRETRRRRSRPCGHGREHRDDGHQSEYQTEDNGTSLSSGIECNTQFEPP